MTKEKRDMKTFPTAHNTAQLNKQTFKLQPDEAFWAIIEQLGADKEYEFHVLEKFPGNLESEKASVKFRTPSCLNLTFFDFNICRKSTS